MAAEARAAVEVQDVARALQEAGAGPEAVQGTEEAVLQLGPVDAA